MLVSVAIPWVLVQWEGWHLAAANLLLLTGPSAGAPAEGPDLYLASGAGQEQQVQRGSTGAERQPGGPLAGIAAARGQAEQAGQAVVD